MGGKKKGKKGSGKSLGSRGSNKNDSIKEGQERYKDFQSSQVNEGDYQEG